METENTTFLRIEAYLGDELSGQERETFEQEMENDPDLAHEVQLQRQTHALLRLNNQLAYKAKLQAFDAEIEAEQTQIVLPIWNRTWLRAAAGIAFLLIVGYSLIYLQYNSGAIGKNAFSPYDNALTVRHSDANLETILKQGIESYTDGDYQKAIQLLSQIPYDSHQPLPRMYLGISHLAIGETQAAREALNPIMEDNSAINQAAEWYWTLSLLTEGEQEAAMIKLEEIADNTDHSYQSSAKDILQDLNHPLKRWLGIP